MGKCAAEALEKYDKKRHFKDTPEPKGKVHKGTGALKFVVQRHDASHLHFDLRLELEGVLKSWAVPKGPSLNPSDKRLAINTEDHPYEYLSFKGIIPEGNYGAGVMDIWDKGTYGVPGLKDRKETEKKLKGDYYKGHLHIEFKGKKLKGEFDLFKTRHPDDTKDNQWMLVKREDKYSINKPYSAENFPTITDVARRYKHGEMTAGSIKNRLARIEMPEGAKETPMPGMTEPMMAKLIDKPFSDPDWVFEIKWDGYRALANVKDGKVLLYSRNLNEYTIYKEVINELKKLPFDAILDGEIVAHDESGKVSFERMQNFLQYKDVALTYNVFDLLYFNGYSLLNVPLVERKRLLEEILPQSDVIVYSEHFREVGEKVFDFAEKHGIEGIMGKRADSNYRPGKRSPDWVKIKTQLYQEGIIVGYTDPKGSRQYFGNLALAVYHKGKLKFIGSSGGGFGEKMLKEIYEKLKPIETDKNPMPEPARGIRDKIHWVKPEYVCEIRFSEWTRDGVMRHPVFKGMRYDKEPREVVPEKPEHRKS